MSLGGFTITNFRCGGPGFPMCILEEVEVREKVTGLLSITVFGLETRGLGRVGPAGLGMELETDDLGLAVGNGFRMPVIGLDIEGLGLDTTGFGLCAGFGLCKGLVFKLGLLVLLMLITLLVGAAPGFKFNLEMAMLDLLTFVLDFCGTAPLLEALGF